MMTRPLHKETDPDVWRMILSLDDETALCGPDGDFEDVEIDDIMASTINVALRDYCTDAGIKDLDAFLHETLSRLDPISDERDIRIVPALGPDNCDYGVLALTADNRIAGVFTGPTLCVDPEMFGQGIGRRLVMERMIRDGGLPTWDHDTPGYSHAGGATILSAVHDLKIRAFVELSVLEGLPEP